METKTCCRCGFDKNLELFVKSSRRASGYTTVCKECESARGRTKYVKYLEKEHARSKKYYRLNYEKERIRAAKKAIRDKDKIAASSKRYRSANPDKIRASKHRRRALERGNNHVPYTATQVLEEYGTNCHICNGPIDLLAPRHTAAKGWEQGLHLDHVLPLCMGGDDAIWNVKPAHGICNIRRNKKKLI